MKDLNNISLSNHESLWQFAHISLWLALLAHLSFGLVFLFFNVLEMAYFNIFSIAVFAFAIYLVKTKQYKYIFKVVFSEVILHAILSTIFIGINSGFYYYIFVLVIVSLIMKEGSLKVQISKSLALMSLFFIIELVFMNTEPVYVLSEEILLYMRIINIFGLIFFSIPFMYFYISLDQEKERKLYNYATVDQLTGLNNRRYIGSIVEYEYSKRDAGPLTLVLADIDFFKKINDNYGHHCGDEVLKEISNTLKDCVRQGDSLSRWGGEEFLIFMPGSTVEDAKVLIKRIRKEIDSLFFTCGEIKGIKSTMTFGIAQRKISESFDDTLARADMALYDGKMAGRDCVIVSEEISKE